MFNVDFETFKKFMVGEDLDIETAAEIGAGILIRYGLNELQNNTLGFASGFLLGNAFGNYTGKDFPLSEAYEKVKKALIEIWSYKNDYRNNKLYYGILATALEDSEDEIIEKHRNN